MHRKKLTFEILNYDKSMSYILIKLHEYNNIVFKTFR